MNKTHKNYMTKQHSLGYLKYGLVIWYSFFSYIKISLRSQNCFIFLLELTWISVCVCGCTYLYVHVYTHINVLHMYTYLRILCVINTLNIYLSRDVGFHFSAGGQPECGKEWTFFFILSSFSSVQFSHSVMSDSLQLHELQHARLPCPSPAPRAY